MVTLLTDKPIKGLYRLFLNRVAKPSIKCQMIWELTSTKKLYQKDLTKKDWGV